MTSFIMSPCFLHQLLRQHGSAFSYYTSMTFWEAEISWFSIITSDKLLSLPELQLPRASHHSWTIVLCCITTFQPTMDQTTYLRTVWSWKNSFLFKNNYFILTITFSLFFFFERGEGRETNINARKKNQFVASQTFPGTRELYAPRQGLNLKPRCVSQLGIKYVILWFCGNTNHLNHTSQGEDFP